MDKLTTEKFIKKAREKHGDKYDYSKTIYRGSKTKSTIICPKHGEFQQRPADHLRYDCRKCGIESRVEKQSISLSEYLIRAREKHGDKYDYSKIPSDATSKSKVIVVCSKHGEFEIVLKNHVYSNGCYRCGKESMASIRRDSQEDFIEKAKNTHGDYYDYSKVDYVNSTTDVIITCPTHGDFMQQPVSHTQGRACPKCGHKRAGLEGRLTQEQFLYKARQMHGDYYDLSKAEYTKGDELIEIICSIHGSYHQKAIIFLTGRGCEPCGRHRAAASRRSSTEEFVAKARQLHGDFYDYSKVDYTTTKGLVTIGCPKHGDFEITANEHITWNRNVTDKPRGCKYCSRSEIHPDDFIEDCRKVHGDRFDYSKTKYTGYHNYITVICPEHGEWKTMAGVFLRSNCPSCATYGFNSQIPAHAYLIKYETPDFVAYKQGITNQKVAQRMVALKRSIKEKYPTAKIKLIDKRYFESGQDARDLEIQLQAMDEIRFTPPVQFDGYTEMYSEGILEHWEQLK